MANIYNAIHSYIEDDRVVASLDGDDFLVDNDVLTTLEKYYSNPDIWMSYGSQIDYPSGKTHSRLKRIPDSVFKRKNLRSSRFTASHLRTFKAGLFKKIKKEDFMYNGAFMDVSWDIAMMIPMLEMCSPCEKSDVNRSTFVEETLYGYRTNNPISDFRIRRALQKKVHQFIKRKKKYNPINTLTSD